MAFVKIILVSNTNKISIYFTKFFNLVYIYPKTVIYKVFWSSFSELVVSVWRKISPKKVIQSTSLEESHIINFPCQWIYISVTM